MSQEAFDRGGLSAVGDLVMVPVNEQKALHQAEMAAVEIRRLGVLATREARIAEREKRQPYRPAGGGNRWGTGVRCTAYPHLIDVLATPTRTFYSHSNTCGREGFDDAGISGDRKRPARFLA